MARVPILLVGDSPTGHSGLGRILRDVAMGIQEHLGAVYDVATLGLGAPPSKSLPFMQYQAANVKEWVLEDLPYAWKDHAGDEEGIIFFMWDISRVLWFAYPEQCASIPLREWRKTLKAKTYIYPAVDGAGPSGGLPTILADALKKFDRVLNYTEFSAKITGYPDVATHGIDTNVFCPRPAPREALTVKFSIALDPDEALIGIVATNQPRKDWALAFGALALLNQQGVKARVWIHTDTDMRHWDLKSLYVDFGLHPNVKVFLTPFGLPDEDLAILYSACDVTIGPGVEGFGFCAAESLCCGTPHVTGSYGGQADFVPAEYQIDPIAYRHEGIFAIRRPVYNSLDLAVKLRRILKEGAPANPVCSWDSVWPTWEKWLRAGL